MARKKLEDTLKERSKDLEVKVELMDNKDQTDMQKVEADQKVVEAEQAEAAKKAAEAKKVAAAKKAAEAKKAEEVKKVAEEKKKKMHEMPIYLL